MEMMTVGLLPTEGDQEPALAVPPADPTMVQAIARRKRHIYLYVPCLRPPGSGDQSGLAITFIKSPKVLKRCFTPLTRLIRSSTPVYRELSGHFHLPIL